LKTTLNDLVRRHRRQPEFMTERFRIIVLDHHPIARKRLTFRLEPKAEFKGMPRWFPAQAARSTVLIAMRYRVDPEFDAPFAVSFLEFLAFAMLFQGVEEIRVGRLAGEAWVVECHFKDPAVRQLFTAAQEYRRHVRRLREFVLRT
jgi:hypothetical protein